MQLAALGQWMIGNHQRAQRLLRDGGDGHVLSRRWVVGQDEIDPILSQSGNKLLGYADADVEADVWMLDLELGDHGRQQFARDRFDGGDTDLTAYQPA